jgi:BirA family transcriptional regulator, biotin operon repressor / biotin---[acetyl-CoA-carboxylase] ligase
MPSPFTVRHYASIGSTSDEAKRLAQEDAPEGTAIHADEQTAGRGRLSRSWFSPPGNLYISIILRPAVPPQQMPELSFVAALAVAETVATLLPPRLRPTLKWPNDVLVEDAKISGILLEMEGTAAILGIGLNILEAPATARYQTTTIVAKGGIASVDSARDTLLERLGAFLTLWESKGFEAIRAAWMALSYPIGATIRINTSGTAQDGQFAGIDDTGALLLQTTAGLERILAGDASVLSPNPKSPEV